MSLLRVGAMFMASACLILSACGGDTGGEDGGSDGARYRVLNVSPDYTSLDVYFDDEIKVTAAPFESATAVQKITADSYEVRFKRNGVSSTLSTLADTLGKGSNTTYIAFGSSGGFGVFTLDEDRSEPDKDETRVEVVQAAADAGSLDVYLTSEDVSLDDTSADYSGVSSGAATGLVDFDSGTYRLRVTAAGSKSDIRLDVSGIVFSSKEVLSIVLSNTPGGSLVNAFLVKQQGEISMLRNASSRVRAAAGVGSGSTVTSKIGGITLLTAANGTTLGAYRLVNAGTHTPDIVVDGAAAATGATELAAGGDFTLLTYKQAGQVVTTLLTDNNRLPSSGFAKVRLLNSMSALNDSLTLSVEFFPVAEAIALGESSAGVQVDPVTDGQIDVTRSNTGQTVFSKSSVELSSRAVYTMAMFGDDATPIGVLRKDR